MLHDCLLQITLSKTPETCSLAHRPHHLLNTREIMYALQLDEQPDPVAHRIWSTNLPKKVQFFAWLLHGRLNTRSSLYRRNIRELDESYCERCVGILEDDDHIFTQCPSARTVWALLGIEHLFGDCQCPWILGKELYMSPGCSSSGCHTSHPLAHLEGTQCSDLRPPNTLW
jgi:hypothetical protein